MGLDKRQRWAVGIGVLALGALLADRMVFLPGPASASAAALSGEEIPRIVASDELLALATTLRGACEASPAEASLGPDALSRLDPFESPWRVVEAAFESENPVAPDEAQTQPAGPTLPILTSVVSAGGRGYAVLDGKPLAVGASRGGYTLVETTDQTATISIDGAVFTLRLHDNKN